MTRRFSGSLRILLFSWLVLCCGLLHRGALHAMPGAGFLFSEDETSLDFGFTMMYGRIRELVYVEEYLLSRLDWDVAPLSGFRVGGAHKFDGWTLSASFMCALPGRSGHIRDYDWAEEDDEGEFLLTGVHTHYSQHPNYVRNAFRLDLDALLPLAANVRWRLDFVVGLTWQRFIFRGRDGFYQYPPSADPAYLTEPKVVTFTTDQILPIAGLMYSRTLGEYFAIGSVLKLGILGYERTYDEHHLRDLDFIDYFILLPYIELRQSLSLSLGRGVYSEIVLFLICFPETRGWSVMEDLSTGTWYGLRSDGGASSFFIGGEVNIPFSF